MPDSGSSHEAKDAHSKQDTILHSERPPEALHRSGRVLVYLAGQNAAHGERKLFDHELDMLEESFMVGQGTEIFKSYHIQAIRVALRTDNFELAEILLAKDPGHELLRVETDLLQVAISNDDTWGRRERSGALTKMIQLLITHGAAINTLDELGNSALYYTCRHGFHATFKLLIDSAADIFTLHDRVPNGDIGGASEEPPYDETSKVNILQVALDSRQIYETRGTFYCIWETPVATKWGSIILFLLDAGLKYNNSDPALVKLLHVACFQGHISYVENLLNFGVDTNTRAARSDSRDYTMGSAIHAAAMGGQRDAIVLMLRKGANPKVNRKTGPPDKLQFETPISAALNGESPFLYARRTQVLIACETLLKAGSSVADGEILLEACLADTGGNFEMAKRLLRRGTRIQHAPICMNLDMVHMILEHGIGIDFAEYQKQAAEKGSLELMRYLVETSGPKIAREDIGQTLTTVLGRNDSAIFWYMLNTYHIDIDETFPLFSSRIKRYENLVPDQVNESQRFSLLSSACRGPKFQAIHFLLKEGASVDCPGLPDTALEYFRQAVRGRSALGIDEVKIIRLLLEHSQKHGEQGTYNGSGDVAKFLLLDETTEVKKSNSEKMMEPVAFRGPHFDGKYLMRPESPTLRTEHGFFDTQSTIFKHEPLLGLQSIRLLVLESSESIEDPIRCHVVHSDLSQSRGFEALSYVWGDPTDTEPILLQGQKMAVTINLWCALRRLRLRDTSRTLWVDALCIDQGNMQERGQQVRMMREIYQTAERVIVWLGENAEGSELVFQYLRDWKPSEDDVTSSYSMVDAPRYDGRVSEAFKKLCYRPWAYRTWTIQEIALAKEAIAMCGVYTQKWRDLTGPMSFNMGLGYHPLRGIDGTTHWNNLQKIGTSASLHSIFKYSILCEASDPRDKIYGILGLFEQQLIPIDYDIGVSEVYRRFTEAVIKRTGKLEILHLFGTSRLIENLESWVPDYSVSSPIGLLPRAYESWTHSVEFPDKILPGLEFRGTELIIKGRSLDIIGAIGDELIANPAYSTDSENFTKVLRNWEVLASTRISTKEYPETLPEAFLQTITAHDDIYKRGVIGGLNWYNQYGTRVLEEMDGLPFQDHRDLRHIEHWAGIPRESGTEHWVSYFTSRMEMVCYGRKFFVTDGGTMGMATPSARAGDKVIFLAGGLYPFVLRSCGDGAFTLVGDCFLYGLDECSLFREGTEPAESYVLR